jgi:hypothetical protein
MKISIGTKLERLKVDIDSLASAACSVMDAEERIDFLLSYSKDKSGGVYYKGVNKGKLRDIYNVDGRLFNKLWDKVRPYVYVSVLRSKYYKDCDLEDAVMFVRERLFYNLRQYGSVHNGEPLSQRIKLIVNNTLTIEASRVNKLGTSVFYGANSFNADHDDVDFTDSVSASDEASMISADLFDTVFWYDDIPREYESAIMLALSECNSDEISKQLPEEVPTTSKWYVDASLNFSKTVSINLEYNIKQYRKSIFAEDAVYFLEKIIKNEQILYNGCGNEENSLYIINEQIRSESMNEGKVIFARDAVEGQTYLSFTRKFKVLVKKIHRYDDGTNAVSSVAVSEETNPSKIIHLAGSATLIDVGIETPAVAVPEEKAITSEESSSSQISETGILEPPTPVIFNINQGDGIEVTPQNSTVDPEADLKKEFPANVEGSSAFNTANSTEEETTQVVNTVDTSTNTIVSTNQTHSTSEGATNMAQSKNPKSKVIDEHLSQVASVEKDTFSNIADAVIAAGHEAEENKKKLVSYIRTRWYRFFKKNDATENTAPEQTETDMSAPAPVTEEQGPVPTESTPQV